MNHSALTVISRLGAHGILNPRDIPNLATQTGHVLILMSDKQWHRASEILRVARGTEGLRRLRDLRKIPGVQIERRRVQQSKDFEYRLVI